MTACKRRRALVPVCLALISSLVVVGVSRADFGGAQGGAGGGGWFGTAESDLDMAGNDVTSASSFHLTAGSADLFLDADGSLGVTGDAVMNGGDLLDVDRLQFNDGESTTTYIEADAGDTLGLHAVLTVIAGVTSATVSAQNVVYANGAANKSLTDAECKGHTWETTGAAANLITFALPDDPAVGDLVTFHVAASHTGGLKVLANTGDTITTDGAVQTTAGAGYLLSKRPGSTLTLMRESATAWRSLRTTGTWAVDSASSAGFAYTPTEWTAYPLVHTWDADADVAETAAASLYRHSGWELTFRGEITFTGAPPAAVLQITAPAGFTIDTTKQGGTGYKLCGWTVSLDANVGSTQSQPIVYAGTGNTVIPYLMAGTAGFNSTVPFTWATGDETAFECTVTVQ